ncbi:12823_t:CDS:2 [Acaulospora morrowiae]|uniref:12823_t:CDS:1 n=1 Tax=Acaulospora morrowiae TaxID=94023 RepID=A0A9N9FFB6_9GLOM|nr:12823_t:CDS:2 [Acaulospora morrowiae]
MASENNSAYEKGPLPTFTIVDSAEKQSSNKLRSCCICIPERTGVAIILSFYFLSGFLSSVASFFYITESSDTLDIVFLVISGILYFLVFVSGFLGLSFIRKDNAVMMYKLSIASWIITMSLLFYNLTTYILEIVFKSSSVQQCQEDFDQEIDCNQVVNIILIKDALKFAFSEFFSVYYPIIHSLTPVLPYAVDQNGQMTPYAAYVTKPPTSLDWIPPPTYTVRANDASSETNNTSTLP